MALRLKIKIFKKQLLKWNFIILVKNIMPEIKQELYQDSEAVIPSIRCWDLNLDNNQVL